MTKLLPQTLYAACAALAAGCALLSSARLPAAPGTSANAAQSGQPVTLTWQTHALYTPSGLTVTGQVQVKSPDYDLSAETVTATLDPSAKAGSAPTVTKAVALAAPGGQVAADIRSTDSVTGKAKAAYHILADKAVYQPDAARPGYGKIDFTGHVQISTLSGFSIGPAVGTTDQATLLFGPDKTKYPQLETGPGRATVTPKP